MTSETKSYGHEIFADQGMAIRHKDDPCMKSTTTSVCIPLSQSPDDWRDCEYSEDGEVEVKTMKYSTLSIKRELAKLGKWDEAKALIERSGAWDDYILANYLAENDPVFVAAKAAFVAEGILTADELAELLPKCVWTAE